MDEQYARDNEWEDSRVSHSILKGQDKPLQRYKNFSHFKESHFCCNVANAWGRPLGLGS